MQELTNFAAYAVVHNGKVMAVTDTFASAVEAAEGCALEVARERDQSTADLPILVSESGSAATEPRKEGYYGRWTKYDEANVEGELKLFFLRVKPAGYLFSGSREERLVATIDIHETTMDLFNGYLVPYPTLREQEEEAAADAEAADDAKDGEADESIDAEDSSNSDSSSSSSDSDSDSNSSDEEGDETYVPEE